jgi:hypothetical protein
MVVRRRKVEQNVQTRAEKGSAAGWRESATEISLDVDVVILFYV